MLENLTQGHGEALPELATDEPIAALSLIIRDLAERVARAQAAIDDLSDTLDAAHILHDDLDDIPIVAQIGEYHGQRLQKIRCGLRGIDGAVRHLLTQVYDPLDLPVPLSQAIRAAGGAA